MSTWGQFHQVHAVDVHRVNSGNVAEGLAQSLIFVIDDQWSTTLDATTVTHLTTTSAQTLALVDLLNIGPGLEATQECDSLLGLGAFLHLVGHDQWKFRDVIDDMASRHDEGWYTRSSNCGDNGIALQVDVDAAVPSAPRLGWGEHATTTTHVTESTLTRAVSTTTTDTGNTGDGTASTPGLGTSLVTGIFADGVWLAVITAHQLRDIADNVWANWRTENVRQMSGSIFLGFIPFSVHADKGA